MSDNIDSKIIGSPLHDNWYETMADNPYSPNYRSPVSKLDAAKKWIKDHGYNPGCLDRFMKSRGM